MTQSLHAEVGARGIYVQAVLPAATRTEIYDRMGGDISKVPDVMEVDDLVDAALIGFDGKNWSPFLRSPQPTIGTLSNRPE